MTGISYLAFSMIDLNLDNSGMTWFPAFITGGLALIGGLIVAFLNHRSLRKLASARKEVDRELADHRADEQRRLTRLEHILSDVSAQAAAKRSYEYEALGRLYESVRPLLFQLGELCEASNRRIDKIISGTIQLSPESTSVRTTAYRIAAPLAIVQALRQRLTTVDMRLDPVIRDQYLVARELSSVLRNGDDLALCPPTLTNYQAIEAPQQHISVRKLDALIEGLTSSNAGIRDLKTFFQFEHECLDSSSVTTQLIAPVIDLLQRAHPHKTPVLWRALMAQRLLQSALLQLLVADNFPASPNPLLRPLREPYASAFDEVFSVANTYLRVRSIPPISLDQFTMRVDASTAEPLEP